MMSKMMKYIHPEFTFMFNHCKTSVNSKDNQIFLNRTQD